MIKQLDWRKSQPSLTVSGDTALRNTVRAGAATWPRRLILLWLVGSLVLLPVDLIKLPLNMLLVDCWILLGLPIFWLSFVRGRHILSLSYAVAMWLILVASFASTFAAPDPMNSIIVIVKEVYAYLWFVTLTAVIATAKPSDLRLLLAVWTGMVFLHGLVIVGQFLSPAFWQLTVSLAGSTKDFEIYRPSGLFVNANSAAFFQALGFVPLVLVSPSQKVGMILGMLLLPTMLLTGSMGAAAAFVAGLAVCVLFIALTGRVLLMLKMFAQLAVVGVLFSGALFVVISQNQRYQEHFARIFLSRAERSSEGRFDLWQRGMDAFVEHDVHLWGIGPENFREVDWQGKQLHNDTLAFAVERGLLGLLGLALFAVVAMSRAVKMVLIQLGHGAGAQLGVVVFLGAMVATLVESLTHQTFHFRELWLILGVQEAMLFQMTTATRQAEPTTHLLTGPPTATNGLVAHPPLSMARDSQPVIDSGR